MFTNKKRERINTYVCAVSLYVAETPKGSIKDHEPTLPFIPLGIVAFSFVGQPFSKQLPIERLSMTFTANGKCNHPYHLLYLYITCTGVSITFGVGACVSQSKWWSL